MKKTTRLLNSKTSYELLDRWRIEEPNVQGFFYHEGGFYHHCYTSARWFFADNLYVELSLSLFDLLSVSSNIKPSPLFLAHFRRTDSAYIYVKFPKDHEFKGKLDVSSVQPVINMAFELVQEQIVVIAYSISENKVRFAYKPYISDTFCHSGRTFSKSVDLKSVKEVQFFNSDSYFVTEEGNLIRHINFFSEL